MATVQECIEKAAASTKAGDHVSAGEYHREACDLLFKDGDTAGAKEQARYGCAAYVRANLFDHARRLADHAAG